MGQRGKGLHMRWRLASENGISLLLKNSGLAHRSQPNAMLQVGSLPLMRDGLDAIWALTQRVLQALGATLLMEKVSRVDACVDLADVPIIEFVEPFKDEWYVMRWRKGGDFALGVSEECFFSSRQATGFVVGKHPLQMRAYDKLMEVRSQPEKLAILVANRWGYHPVVASRVEFELGRERLKRFGVDSLADWVAKRGAILDSLTSNSFRLTAGPVDRRHADRAGVHPIWERTCEAFTSWCGASSNVDLSPLASHEIDLSQQFAVVVGLLKSCLARNGRPIDGNEEFLSEVSLAVREAIQDRDLAAEVRRRRLELGLGQIQNMTAQ